MKKEIGLRGNVICIPAVGKSKDTPYTRHDLVISKAEKKHWGFHFIQSEGFPPCGVRIIKEDYMIEYWF